jgi:hypothetical protein
MGTSNNPSGAISMGRQTVALVLLIAAIAASGCFEAKTLVTVQKDGSGTLDQIVYYTEIDPAALGLTFGAEGSEGGEFDFGEVKKPTEQEQLAAARDQAEKTAEKMGEGVRVTAVKALPPKNARKGIRISYAFDDINQLRLEPVPEVNMGGGFQLGSAETALGDLPANGQFGEAAAPAGEGEGDKIRFEFTAAPKPTLTIFAPPVTPPSGAQPVPDDPQAKQMAVMMMRQMFDGMFMEFRIKFAGRVTDTDAKYVNRKANVVGLYRMDFGSLVKEQAALDKLLSMDPAADAETVKQQLDDPLLARFLKLETNQRVSVSFE